MRVAGTPPPSSWFLKHFVWTHFFQRGRTMEVVTRRQSGDLTHVLSVERDRNTCSRATQKDLLSKRRQSVPKTLPGPPLEVFFSFLYLKNSKKENAKVKLARARKQELSFYLEGLNALCDNTKGLVSKNSRVFGKVRLTKEIKDRLSSFLTVY